MTDQQFEILMKELANHRQEMKAIRQDFVKVVNYIHDAESEVPEKLRRFMNYMHDLHDIKYMYEELGHVVPAHQLREMERCDDRFRQILLNDEKISNTIDKVRREMSADPLNRWDHAKQLMKPNGACNETGSSIEQLNGIDEGRAEEPRS